MSGPDAWLSDDQDPATLTEEAAEAGVPLGCTDPDCDTCQATTRVAETGARALCEQVDVDYDTLDAGARAHYQHIAAEVMAAMSAAMLDTGLVREKESTRDE